MKNQSESVLQYTFHFCAYDNEIASQARLFGPVFTGLIKILHSVLSIALSWQRALVNFGNRNSNMFFFHRTRLASVISSRLESLKAISIWSILMVFLSLLRTWDEMFIFMILTASSRFAGWFMDAHGFFRYRSPTLYATTQDEIQIVHVFISS